MENFYNKKKILQYAVKCSFEEKKKKGLSRSHLQNILFDRLIVALLYVELSTLLSVISWRRLSLSLSLLGATAG